MIKTNLVIGAGLSGATIARLIAEKSNEEVIVIDKKDHIAGNCYDYRDNNGIMIQKYGTHIFHTNNQEVWDFVNKFSNFNTYMHEVVANIDGIEACIPFNLNTLHQVFPKSLADELEKLLLEKYPFNSKVPILEFKSQNNEKLNFLAEYIYNKVFINYTTKQWGIDPESIDPEVTARVPVLVGVDNRYFNDKYQGLPTNGFTNMVNNILQHKNIKVELNTEYNESLLKKYNPERVIYSGSIDEYFNYKFGILPYRSVYFKFEEYSKSYYQSHAVINYPNNYDFTRIHEYKHLLSDVSEKTVIAKEYSEEFLKDHNERYYPINSPSNTQLYKDYLDEAKKIKGLYFLGRLGDYKYFNMDQAIERAFSLFKEIKDGYTEG